MGGSTISGASQAAAGRADRFAQAYDALRHDRSIQFQLTAPPPAQKPPMWLKALLNQIGKLFEPIGRFLNWIAGFFPDAAYARIALWAVIGAGAAALLWAAFVRLRTGKWRLRLPRSVSVDELEAEEQWAPSDSGARSWLEEADALASEGRFAEAIHHLLFRSIEDIQKRRPNLVRPAITSRELAAADGIPSRARELFAAIARLVERSLFGGRDVGEADWQTARQSYADFALAGAWRR